MRIDFDTTDTRQVLAVRALIDALAARGASVAHYIATVTPSQSDIQRHGGADTEAEYVPQGGDEETGLVPLAPPAAVASPAVPPPPAGITASPAPSGVDVDADGLPWDARIHSSNHAKVADGTWRKKRGVADELVALVTAELRQAMAAPARPEPMFTEDAPGESDPGVDAATAFSGAAATPVASAPPPPPPAAAVPPPPPAPAAPVAEAPAAAPVAPFPALMRRITAGQTAGLLTIGTTTEIAQSLGLSGIRDLMARPDLIPSFEALLPEGV